VPDETNILMVGGDLPLCRISSFLNDSSSSSSAVQSYNARALFPLEVGCRKIKGKEDEFEQESHDR